MLFNASADDLDFPCVSTDDMTAAGQAYTHLASLGHQRIGLVAGPEDHMPSRRKLAAFTAHARRVSASAPVEHALFSLESGQAATTRLLRHGVTGVICASDVLALGAIRAIRRAGLSVPGDVSVVGYDDSAFMNCTVNPAAHSFCWKILTNLTEINSPTDGSDKDQDKNNKIFFQTLLRRKVK